ncbi:MAG TPA: NAD(+) synthase [Clostridiaceae bacterium]|nr:NAD(+) synthase [Clostridiaceae bacterium]
MRDYNIELKNRIQFIRDCLNQASASGIVYGNSGGKDSALTGILCKMACDNTVGLVMPCRSKRNYSQDKDDALAVARQFGIEVRVIDLGSIMDEFENSIRKITSPSSMALANTAPRIRMTMLYAVAASENRLVAGTGNKSEGYMGYFTKWGDGAYDFNPIADLTVTEIYEFLRFLKVTNSILEKAPSAGLFDGQTDEKEMGITYKVIDTYLQGDTVSEADRLIIEKFHRASEHKRRMPLVYGG